MIKTGILIDKPNDAKNNVYTREYCCYCGKCAWSAINNSSPSFLTIEDFGDIIWDEFCIKALILWRHIKVEVQLIQKLKSIDHPMCFRFAMWASDWLTEDVGFGEKKKISSEAQFDLGGYVSKQNLGHRKKTAHCLMHILVPSHNWAIFLLSFFSFLLSCFAYATITKTVNFEECFEFLESFISTYYKYFYKVMNLNV